MLLTYRTMADRTHADLVCRMMAGLYAEDPPAAGDAPRDFRATVDHMLSRPDRGRVVLFDDGGDVCGYALLVPFWSNELGGQVVVVDELYVRPDRRGRGIGSGLLAGVERDRPFDAAAVVLEVSAANHRAARLYESPGFRARANRTLVRRLPEAARARSPTPGDGGYPTDAGGAGPDRRGR